MRQWYEKYLVDNKNRVVTLWITDWRGITMVILP